MATNPDYWCTECARDVDSGGKGAVCNDCQPTNTQSLKKRSYHRLWESLDDINPTDSGEAARRAAQLERGFRSLERDLREHDPEWLYAFQREVGL